MVGTFMRKIGWKIMIKAKSKDGEVEIYDLKGSEDRIVCDIGVLIHKILLLTANAGAKTKEEVYVRYGFLVRKVVDYLEITVKRIDEME